jgi:two-component system LytT family response regulator
MRADILDNPTSASQHVRYAAPAESESAMVAGEPSALPSNEAGPLTRFTVRANGRVTFVPVDEVDYLEAARNYVRLHVRDQQYVLRATMQSLSARLDPKRFARVHKSTILNMSRIREVQPWFGGDYVAILTTGERVKISRTYARAVLRPTQ